MSRRVSLAAVLVAAVATAEDASLLRGDYHFVQLSVRPGPQPGKLDARNAGGTISFDGAGGATVRGRAGSGREEATKLEAPAKYTVASNVLTLSDPLREGGSLRVRFGEGAAVLLGSSAESGDSPFDLFVAVRAGSGAAPRLEGEYAGGYMVVRDGLASGLGTAFVEMGTQGSAFINATVTGHVAGIDDVNRSSVTEKVPVSLGPGGVGTADFTAASDVLTGRRQIMLSGDGAVMLGFSTQAGERDILVAVKRQQGATIRGFYWMAEIAGENQFVFAPETVRLSSAMGSVRSAGDGRALIAQSFWTGGKRTNVTTVNSYLVGTDGTAHLALNARYGVRNFSHGASMIAGAQVAPVGELTLEHGLFVAIRAPQPAATGVLVSPVTTPIAPGATISLTGTGMASAMARATPPLSDQLGGVRVLVGGEPAKLLMVSPNQIDFIAPLKLASPANIQVDNNGRMSSPMAVDVAGTSPVVLSMTGMGTGTAQVTRAGGAAVDENNPAKEGEVVSLFATGLGPVPDGSVRVLIGGVPADVSFVGLAPGLVGVYRIDIKVPAGVATGALTMVPIAVATADSFTDMTDLPLTK